MNLVDTNMSRLWVTGEVHELRAFGDKSFDTKHGFFDDFPAFCEAAQNLDANGYQVYWTINPAQPPLLARSKNKLRPLGRGGGGLKDKEVAAQNRMVIDIDPVRPSGISATNEELASAKLLAGKVIEFLTGQGWPEPTAAISGNGVHLWYELAVRGRGNYKRDKRISLALTALAYRFDNNLSVVDTTVFSPAQLIRVYGTTAKKGDSTPDRPHRRAAIWRYPAVSGKVTPEQMKTLSLMAPEKEKSTPGPATESGGEQFNAWMESHFSGNANGPTRWQGKANRWVFSRCPFDSGHGDSSAYLLRFDSGVAFF